MPELVLIRNNAPGPTVFEDPETQSPINWEGSKDPAGQDLQYVKEDLLNDPRFRRVLDRGVLSIEEASEETMQRFQRQHEEWRAKQAAREAQALESVQRDTDRDLVGVECVGPNPRGSGQCGVSVPVRSGTKTDTPPLCNQHAHLAAEYVMVQVPEKTEADGFTPLTTWVRSTLSSQPLPSQQQS